MVLYRQDNFSKAESLWMEVVARLKEVHGTKNHESLTYMSNLATMLNDLGQFFNAKPMAWKAFAGREKLFGLEDPRTLCTMRSLAFSLFKQEKHLEAETVYRTCFERLEKTLGPLYMKTLEVIG
jgi:hypothetical protein